MSKAARNLSQRKQAGFRAALVILFVAEAVAFNRFVGPVDASVFTGIIGVASLLVLPLALGAFRRFLSVCAFYAAFLFAFAGLIFVPSITAARANYALRVKCAKVKCVQIHLGTTEITRQPGMTRQQVNAIFSGYQRKDFPSLAETLRQKGYKDWNKLGCGNAYYSNSNFYAVTRGRFGHKKCVVIQYDWNDFATSSVFYDVADEDVPEKQNFAAVNSAVRAVRGFLWLFTKDCAYDSSK